MADAGSEPTGTGWVAADWIGRRSTRHGQADAALMTALGDVLDHETPPWPQGEMPALGHWLSFAPAARQSRLGADGHPRRGGDLPPIDLPRRMWAASELRFLAPVPIGARLTQDTDIAGIETKQGSSGPLVFLTLAHTVSADGVPRIEERQTIVYRQATTAHTAAPPLSNPVPDTPWRRRIVPDPVLLFRFSALTYNAHRIHYDRPYATEVEGYPGLVVHGPLVATLLMDLYLRHATRPPKIFRFRARSALFDGEAVTLTGTPTDGGASLGAYGPDGTLAMSAEVTA